MTPLVAMQLPLTHPRPIKTDQHVVVTLLITQCSCDFAGHLLSLGIEPLDAAPRVTVKAQMRKPNFPSWRVMLASVSLPATDCIELGLRLQSPESQRG